MGTATVSVKKRNVGVGASKEVVADITLSGSYATGGDTVTIASLELDSIDALMLTSNANGYNIQVVHGANNRTAPKLKVYQGDNANAGAAAGIEVPNATSLATVVVRVVASGENPNI